MSAIILKNARLHVTSDEFRHADSLAIQDHRIIPADSTLIDPNNAEEYDMQGMHIAPGFIDLLVNGCGGVSFASDPSIETLETMRQYLLKRGTTTFVPTLISGPRESLSKALTAVADFKDKRPGVCPGLHMEGPFINPQHKGFQPAGYIRPLTQSDIEFMRENADAIAYITLAPELIKPQLILDLLRSRFILSIGHTATTYQVAMHAFKAGINNVTHIYNGMRSTVGREPGLIGALLSTQKITASVIADGRHVHPALIRIAHQNLGKRLYIVSDCQAVAGADINEGSFTIYGNEIFIDKKRGLIDSRGALAGTSMTLMDSIKYLIDCCNFTLDEALTAATEVPASVLNLRENGRIEGGFIADLVCFDDDFHIHYVVQNGFVKGPGDF